MYGFNYLECKGTPIITREVENNVNNLKHIRLCETIHKAVKHNARK